MTAHSAADDSVPPRHWIGVVSREHVRPAISGGFAMLNRGKLAVTTADAGRLADLSLPRTACPDGEPLQAFTAIGEATDQPPCSAGMPAGASGYRRDMTWHDATETPIASLSERLEFTREGWGMLTRRGLFDISAADLQTIRDAMTTS
jgi:hypothetical protein